MKTYSLTHLSDQTLLRALAALAAQDCATTAELVAHIAEVDARRLYVPAGYPSMYLYCVQELHLSEQAAYRRIHAGRTARRCPALFTALAEGRLHLTAIEMLAPYLTPENADDLLAAATHLSKAALEQLLAQRFPRPDLPACLQALAPPMGQLSPARVAGCEPPAAAPVGTPGPAEESLAPPAPERHEIPAEQLSPARVEAPAARPKLTALAPARFALQLTLGQETHDKLRHAQALLAHRLPSGDLGAVLDRALDALIRELEKTKFAATRTPRPAQRRASANPRHIPAHVKRAVWQRDGGRCTFVSEAGHRCAARTFLEYDHIDPVARGGEATAARMRLRCRAHNQFEAERVFGVGFMGGKRDQARRRRELRGRPPFGPLKVPSEQRVQASHPGSGPG